MGDGILECIGHTPLMELERFFAGESFRVWAKLEGFNPAGSSKDRPAKAIIQHALERGELRPGATVVESSSGNMGVGLAQVCRRLGLHFICVVDPLTEQQNLKILEAYGASVEVVRNADPQTGNYLQARIDRVRALRHEIPGSFWPNQYANEANVDSHYSTTMPEILDQMGGDLDYLFCATSTTGTIMGCAKYAKDQGLDTRLIAVDARGSVIFGGENGRRLVPGLGAARVPELCHPSWISGCVYVDDRDCVEGCRRLVDTEAILAGGSSGGVVQAVWSVRDSLPAGARCAVILPDRGERYLETIYSDAWVAEHFDAETVRQLGKGKQEVLECAATSY